MSSAPPKVSSKRMTAAELREAFIGFFAQRGHEHLPSASLVPQDKTLLLTSAGMVQFKEYLSGEVDPKEHKVGTRAVTCQKCMRTTDLEAVGDATHLTFFEMLGNFSFNDYSKQEACAWGRELMLDVLGFDPDRLLYTIHPTDDEAHAAWRGLGVPEERIHRFEDNWWGPVGGVGACGPCSEIYVYMGDMDELKRNKFKMDPDDPRFIELYNLVFPQFYRTENGEDRDLERKNVDTGMGLERVLMAMQQVESPYDTDLLKPLTDLVRGAADEDKRSSAEHEPAIRIITEHLRAALFMLADGVIPDSGGRGYVLRRLIRRAAQSGRSIGLKQLPLKEFAEQLIGKMGDTYPELQQNGEASLKAALQEEADYRNLFDNPRLEPLSHFNTGMQKLRSGNYKAAVEDFSRAIALAPEFASAYSNRGMAKHELGMQDDATADYDKAKELTGTQAGGLSGGEGFRFHDTYGVPLEEIQELVSDEAERQELERLLEEKRQRDAAGAKFKKVASTQVFEDLNLEPTAFLGYDKRGAAATLKAIIRDGQPLETLPKGEDADLVFDQTPFYAERGGQIGDTGTLRTGEQGEAIAAITDTQDPYRGIYVHSVERTARPLKAGEKLFLEVDSERREKIMRNHTATHLVHAALREVLGTSAKQHGSLVHPDYLRFDFTHSSAVSAEQLVQVQDIVNRRIRDNLEVTVHHTTYGKAVEEGALAFFEGRYKEEVRTIKIDVPWSYELCGGTHMATTGGIGAFAITSESGIANGVRRIFAITGTATEGLIGDVQSLARDLNASKLDIGEVRQKFAALQKERDEANSKAAELEKRYLKLLSQGGGKAAEAEHEIQFAAKDGTEFAVQARVAPVPSMDALRKFGDSRRDSLKRGVVILASELEGEAKLVVMVTKDLAGSPAHAGEIAKALSAALGGSGGGNPAVGQGGGKDAAKLESVLSPKSIAKILGALYG